MSSKLLSHRSALCNVVRRIALEAGEIIMPYYDGLDDLQTEEKADGSPVTQADRAAEAFITEKLFELVGNDIPVIGEEAVADGKIGDLSGCDYFWLVDPVDGTREFIAGGDDFTVNIGLIHKGNPVLGVILAPARNELYCGYISEDGTSSAFRYIEETDRDKEMRVRNVPKFGMTVMASTHHRAGGRLDQFLEDYKVEKIVRRASSLKICAVAAGKADLYVRLGPTGEWDTAAGDAILRAAGGMIVDFTTKAPLAYGRTDKEFVNPEFMAAGLDFF